MQHQTSHSWHLHLRGSLHVMQGWLTGDQQRVLQGRYERLLAEIDQVQRRVRTGVPAADHDHTVAVVPPQQLA